MSETFERRMMNVRCLFPFADPPATQADCYKYGHRDARHACAEIALEADAALAAARTEAENLRAELARVKVAIFDYQGDDVGAQVEKEIADYKLVMGECTKVYEHFSGLTKANTAAEHVISFGEEQIAKHVAEVVKDETENLRAEVARLRAFADRVGTGPLSRDIGAALRGAADRASDPVDIAAWGRELDAFTKACIALAAKEQRE